MSKLGWIACVAAGVTILEGVSLFVEAETPPTSSASRTAFPHAAHAGLFPTCAACHAGIESGDATRFYTVHQRDCARCHDGKVQPWVEWSQPPARTANLEFSHRVHATSGIACNACHATSDNMERMAVAIPGPERCLECHGSTPHLAAATKCEVCHAPLASATQVPASRIAAYQPPADHQDPAFLQAHGRGGTTESNRCAICHARESCERCHLNADRLPMITALAPDARVRELQHDKPGHWPAPADHADRDWVTTHGASARAGADACANCHVQSSCTGCHAELSPPGLAALPASVAGEPRGVHLAGARPPHHPPGFDRRHAAAASSQSLQCATCHSESYCASCHEAAFEPQFHPRDFRTRHAAEAYARDTDCASCHSTEAFCRDCHATTGIASPDSRTAAYHDAHPMWLLDHGRAARQGMDTCVSCHQQTDCLQCHSARSGWRIDPHGPEFDANRMGGHSLESCAVCHFSDPRR